MYDKVRCLCFCVNMRSWTCAYKIISKYLSFYET